MTRITDYRCIHHRRIINYRPVQQIFQVFESPILRVKFTKADNWIIQKVSPMRIGKLTEDELQSLYKFSKEYFSRKRFRKNKLKQKPFPYA